METLNSASQKFNSFVGAHLKPNNKYIVAAVSVFLAIYAGIYAPKLPEFLVKLLDNMLVKILLLFMILYINLNHDPTTALLIAIFIAVLMMTLNLVKKDRETMASIHGNPMHGIPQYVHYKCGSPRPASDPVDALRGPVSGVSDADAESLCMHVGNSDTGDFSELLDDKTCKFASHQYRVDSDTHVVCTDATSGNSPLFSELAPAF